jgi:mannose-6-phosphate isomerase-like protein (cupin superfamily)
LAQEGQEIEGPNGFRLRFVLMTEDLLEMDAHYAGRGDLPPAHFHPSQAEHFEVLDGAVRTVIADEPKRYAAGESFDVAARVVHQMAGDGPARVKWQIRPALRTAEFLEAAYSGAGAEDPMGFLERFSDEFRLAES